MAGLERPRAEQVLKDILESYSADPQYDLLTTPLETGVSVNNFACHRLDKISPIINPGESDYVTKEKVSYISEWIVLLGFKKMLSESELNIELAPPYLEIGSNGRRGVDLVASRVDNDSNIPVFAINVKLRCLREGRKSDYYKYDPVLGCPSIDLSIGDFSVKTKKSGEVSIVPWVTNVATPNITNSGQIPYFYKWQKYLAYKSFETISHYMIKTDDYLYSDYKPSTSEQNLFPVNDVDFPRFYNNLCYSYLFLKGITEKQ